MASTYVAHLVEKSNIASHTCIPVVQDRNYLPTLQDGCILARTRLVSLTANNLSYAHAGTLLHWWDAFPAPSADQSKYGIVPAWGYAEVIGSKIPDILLGRLIWGFWPTYDLPVVLQLVQGDVKGHWIEVSEHRSKMMSLYNRYIEAPDSAKLDTLNKNELERMAWETVLAPVGGAGWALNRFVFGGAAIHPFGFGDWSSADADLSKAIVVSLSASGKTARFFTHGLIHDRKPGTGPLGLLAITSSDDGTLVPKASFPTKTVLYSDTTSSSTMKWVSDLQPKKLVIVDFGSRGDSLDELTDVLRPRFSSVKLVIIGVGREAKPFSPNELASLGKKMASMEDRVQMNASGIYDKAMEIVGKEAFFQERGRACENFIQKGGLGKMQLQIGEGVDGENGIEGGWTRLCKQQVSQGGAMVFRV